MKWGVVVPSIRPEGFQEFLRAWTPLFDKHEVDLFVVWDLEERPTIEPFKGWQFESTWKDRPDFIPRQTDMCRSWGFFQAYNEQCDYILSLDDDVRPVGDPFAEYEFGFERQQPLDSYLHVGALSTAKIEMRGFPYRGRNKEVAVQYGGWHGVPDLGAVEQLAIGTDGNSRFQRIVMPVPKGVAATCCAMNFAFKREFTPLMWQLPLWQGKYNRMGDIWSGLIQKRVLDSLDKVMLINGKASVAHARASDPLKNLEREGPGIPLNEGIWDALGCSELDLTMQQQFLDATKKAYFYLKEFNVPYAMEFIRARNEWHRLFL